MYQEDPGIGRLIARVRQRIYNLVAQRLKGHDLDVGQFFFLRYILMHEGKTQEEIARNMLLDKATVSKALKRLVHLGYATQRVNEKDKRENKIYATARARQLLPQMENIYQTVYRKLHLGLNGEEQKQLKALLLKVYRNLENPEDIPDGQADKG